MNICLIGGGSVGLLAGAYLQMQNHTVTLICRTCDQAHLISKEGITLHSGDASTFAAVNAQCSEKAEINNTDLIIITVKQTELDDVLEWGRSHFPAEPPVLLLQNGMGHVDKALHILQNPILAGVVSHGALRISPAEVRHTGNGNILIGGDKNLKPLIASVLTSDSRFPVEWRTDIDYIMRRKLLVNVVINTLTAIHNVKNGCLLKNESLKQEAKSVFEEAAGILNLNEDEWEYVLHVLEATSENTSSMLQDHLKKRKSECDAITGYLLKKARASGGSYPVLANVHDQLKKVEDNFNG